jgi:hypothetical protein
MDVVEGPVGARPRWPDVVIAAAIVALVAVGVAALFGDAIRGWFTDDEPPPAARPEPAPGGRPT